MTYIVVVRKDGEEASLEFEDREEAQYVMQSFKNYSKYEDVYMTKKDTDDQ